METSDVELGPADSIDETVKFLLDHIDSGGVLSKQPRPTIYIVPSVFRDLSPTSFNPRVVSIGPLHKQDQNLQNFEAQKTTYLHDLFTRLDSNQDQTMHECVQKVLDCIDRIKECYSVQVSYNDFELARMMVIDACFILDFILQLKKENGPLRKNMFTTQPIIYDLLLIENQIPFFVLQDIFECTILKFEPDTSLMKHFKVLLRSYHVFDATLRMPNIDTTTTHDHILGLLHKSFQPATEDIASRFNSIPKGHSALELDRAGVNFTPFKDENWPMAMKLKLPKFSCFPWFWCKPSLGMPVLCIDDFTELVLRNLVIYEQSCLVRNYVTAYACAMDMLIDTPEDVAMLVKSKVLVNDLGSNENAANMINNICKEVAVVDFFYFKDWESLDTYYNSYWPSSIAGLRRKYFSSPWTIIALCGAIVIFVLTVVQTIFTIKTQ